MIKLKKYIYVTPESKVLPKKLSHPDGHEMFCSQYLATGP